MRRRRPPAWAAAVLAVLAVTARLDGLGVFADADDPAAAAATNPYLPATTTTTASHMHRALLQAGGATPSSDAAPTATATTTATVTAAGGRTPTPPGRCKVLALPCVASVLGQAGAGPCSGPASFDRDNTCCPIVRDFVQSGCACDGPFLAIASFGGWNGEKLAQAVRTILSTPCGKGLKDGTCLLTCPPRAPQPK